MKKRVFKTKYSGWTFALAIVLGVLASSSAVAETGETAAFPHERVFSFWMAAGGTSLHTRETTTGLRAAIGGEFYFGESQRFAVGMMISTFSAPERTDDVYRARIQRWLGDYFFGYEIVPRVFEVRGAIGPGLAWTKGPVSVGPTFDATLEAAIFLTRKKSGVRVVFDYTRISAIDTVSDQTTSGQRIKMSLPSADVYSASLAYHF